MIVKSAKSKLFCEKSRVYSDKLKFSVVDLTQIELATEDNRLIYKKETTEEMQNVIFLYKTWRTNL